MKTSLASSQISTHHLSEKKQKIVTEDTKESLGSFFSPNGEKKQDMRKNPPCLLSSVSVFSTRSAFTLVELMIVIAIIWVLSASLFPMMSGYMAKARDTQRVQDMSQLHSVAQLYFSDFGHYPAETLAWDTSCGSLQYYVGIGISELEQTCDKAVAGTGWWYNTGAWKDFTAFSQYVRKLPIDPLNTGNFFYAYEPLNAGEWGCVSAGCQYLMYIHLESLKNPNVWNGFQALTQTGWYRVLDGTPNM